MCTCLSRFISCSSSASRVRVWYSCSPAPGVRPLFASASSLYSWRCSSCLRRSSMSWGTKTTKLSIRQKYLIRHHLNRSIWHLSVALSEMMTNYFSLFLSLASFAPFLFWCCRSLKTASAEPPQPKNSRRDFWRYLAFETNQTRGVKPCCNPALTKGASTTTWRKQGNWPL